MFAPRVEADSYPPVAAPALSAPYLLGIPDDEIETPPLPHEHPKWVKDALAVSYRARKLLTRVRPALIRVLTFWDHQCGGVQLSRGRLSVDFSGSYRLE